MPSKGHLLAKVECIGPVNQLVDLPVGDARPAAALLIGVDQVPGRVRHKLIGLRVVVLTPEHARLVHLLHPRDLLLLAPRLQVLFAHLLRVLEDRHGLALLRAVVEVHVHLVKVLVGDWPPAVVLDPLVPAV